MYGSIGMRFMEMDAASHDQHIAYVSHISHVTSFVLATTVLEMEKSASTIFDLAGSGFESTVRLAKSSPDMWTPIFAQNADYVCEALDAYIRNIAEFRNMIARGVQGDLHATMERANKIRRILEGMNSQNHTHLSHDTIRKE
jgi:prephenate dehydrogenase